MAYIIANELGVEDFDEKNLKMCCPFHDENTPSFVWNRKSLSYHCFGACGKSYDIIDIFMYKGLTYIEAVQRLFELASIQYAFGEHKVQTKRQYKYPKPIECKDKSQVYSYLNKRKISEKTVDYLDIRQDEHGNVVFNYYDENDTLTMVKYRPSRKINKGENKNWCQKDADTFPLLFNMNRINTSQPLLITSGELDCAAAIEAGWLNSVSIPLGDQNTAWIEKNYEWLEQFNSIIVCADNDESGSKYLKDVVPRLGSWRCKIAIVPDCYESPEGTKTHLKDINELLFYCGKEAVMNMILNAKDSPVPSVDDLSDVQDVDLDEIDGIRTGIESLDKELMRLFFGTLTIISGMPGCVDCETEFFTGSRWKKISEYEQGDKVLQYNEDGSANLVDPIEYHRYPCDDFYHFKTTRGIDQMLSGEHNLVYKSSRNSLKKKPVAEIVALNNKSKNGFNGKIPTTFTYGGSEIDLTDEEIRVMCAVICDGTFNDYSSKARTYQRVRINIKKPRKIDRLRMLLNAAGIEWEEKKWNNTDPDYVNFLFEAPIRAKVFDSYWYNCSNHQLKVITDEILFWDGSQSEKRRSYSTTVRENADFIQFAFSSTGQRASIYVQDRVGQPHKNQKYIRKSIEYGVIISSSGTDLGFATKTGRPKRDIILEKTGDGFKYCFTVPSGMLVLRRNGNINITGNSGKTSFLYQLICQALDQGYNTWLFSGELPENMTKNWFTYIFSGARHTKKYQSENGDAYYKVSPNAKKAIDDCYRGRWFVYKDDYDNNLDSLLESMIDVVRKYGVKLLVLDNLMCIDADASEEELREQTKVIKKLIAFSKKYNVATILVCHPRKLSNTSKVGMYDINGTANISNLAHRTIALRRVTDEERENPPKNPKRRALLKFDVLANIIKDRMRGRSNIDLGLYYDPPSRRFFTTPEEYEYQYAWDNQVYKDHLQYPIKEDEDDVYGKIGDSE